MGAVLTVLARTTWLQSHTLRKCAIVSLLVHGVLAIVAAMIGGATPASWGQADVAEMSMVVVMAEEPSDDPAPSANESLDPSPDAEGSPENGNAVDHSPTDLLNSQPDNTVDAPPDFVPLLEAPREEIAEQSEPIPDEKPLSEKEEPALLDVAIDAYADRSDARKASAAASRGGSVESERAVHSALAWLSAAQSPDGRWSAARHGAGTGQNTGTHHRQSGSAKADHGVTGLALLAMLGAGNTHHNGPYADHVHRGIQFLINNQSTNGSLAGNAEFFASLYCHGMATIALAETVAMTGDETLQLPLKRAVEYTLSMQHPQTGGWRYAPGDRGDTSQHGWQVMVLSSASTTGLKGIEQAKERAKFFIQSVSSGANRGLASYRAGERASIAMTAEALTCRLLLGMKANDPAAVEAIEWLQQSLPESTTPNVYAWYYGTLASFHAGGPQWERWNASIQKVLIQSQRQEKGPLDGSWDPDSVWGWYGGRVYSTSMSAMMLEVYYRYLPMHERQQEKVAVVD